MPEGRASRDAGVVVIGRNEGDRLPRCLRSLAGSAAPVVYVDSGSSDGSVARARAAGALVLELDPRLPFTAARARNAGLERLRAAAPGLDYVQFVDADCELAGDWLERAVAFLAAHDEVAAVSGRLRERFPGLSIYNTLCDIEWGVPTGEAKSCGGIAMMRVRSIDAVHGFRSDLIAGEEPELCARLRKAGWKIWRLAHDMGTHDASMTRFGQWWTRSVRAGYAAAQGASLHGAPPERLGVRESRSEWIWSLVIPLATLALGQWLGAWALGLLAIYPAQIVRLTLRGRRTPRENRLYALFLVLGKFPGMLGQLKFVYQRLIGRQSRLIEYK